jgi:heat shock protein HslJ
MKKITIFSIFALVALLLSACGGPDESVEELDTALPDEMLDTIWEWTEIVVTDPEEWSSPIADPPNYTVFFNSDGFSDVEADCNFVQGEYEVEGESLNFSVGAPTFSICGPETASCQYLVYMSQVDSYRLEDGKLILPFGNGTGELIFSAVGATGSGPPSSGGDPSGPDEPDGPGGPIDPPDDDGNKKVTVCHKADGKNPVTLEISKNALKAHLAHGDKEGACP